jgi:hypothetical protein
MHTLAAASAALATLTAKQVFIVIAFCFKLFPCAASISNTASVVRPVGFASKMFLAKYSPRRFAGIAGGEQEMLSVLSTIQHRKRSLSKASEFFFGRCR